jgi:hypothetical protein
VISFTGLTPPHVCAYPKQGPGFPMPYVVVYFTFNGLRDRLLTLKGLLTIIAKHFYSYCMLKYLVSFRFLLCGRVLCGRVLSDLLQFCLYCLFMILCFTVTFIDIRSVSALFALVTLIVIGYSNCHWLL